MDDTPKSPPIENGQDHSAAQAVSAPSELEPVATGGPPPLVFGKNDLFPYFALVWLSLNLIHGAPSRVRRASEKQIRGVLQSIQTYGFRIPILVRTNPDGTGYEVIDGYARLEAARRLGAVEVPCIVVDDLPDVQIRKSGSGAENSREP